MTPSEAVYVLPWWALGLAQAWGSEMAFLFHVRNRSMNNTNAEEASINAAVLIF
jgi:hypothetical protein